MTSEPVCCRGQKVDGLEDMVTYLWQLLVANNIPFEQQPQQL